jgi:hypothetical protein
LKEEDGLRKVKVKVVEKGAKITPLNITPE